MSHYHRYKAPNLMWRISPVNPIRGRGRISERTEKIRKPWRGAEKCVQLRENQEQAVTSHLPASDVVLFSSGNGMGCIIIGSGCTASKLSSMSEPRTSCPNSQIGDNIVNCPILSVHFKAGRVSLSAIKNKIDRIFNITLKKTERLILSCIWWFALH